MVNGIVPIPGAQLTGSGLSGLSTVSSGAGLVVGLSERDSNIHSATYSFGPLYDYLQKNPNGQVIAKAIRATIDGSLHPLTTLQYIGSSLLKGWHQLNAVIAQSQLGRMTQLLPSANGETLQGTPNLTQVDVGRFGINPDLVIQFPAPPNRGLNWQIEIPNVHSKYFERRASDLIDSFILFVDSLQAFQGIPTLKDHLPKVQKSLTIHLNHIIRFAKKFDIPIPEFERLEDKFLFVEELLLRLTERLMTARVMEPGLSAEVRTSFRHSYQDGNRALKLYTKIMYEDGFLFTLMGSDNTLDQRYVK